MGRTAFATAGQQSQVRLPTADTAVPRIIIRTGSARVEVEQLDSAIARARAWTQRYGGYIGNISIQAGREQVRQAQLEIKIPANRFDAAVDALGTLGKVESVQLNAEDVSEEYVDATARLNNARRLEERLIDLLTTRTGKLEEVLAVERELARVREEIERIEGRLRFLRSRAAVSSLLLDLHEPEPLLSRPGDNVLLSAFIRAWRNFVNFIAGGIAALGYALPLAALVALVWWLLRRRRATT